MISELVSIPEQVPVVHGMNVTADSFYSSQGRVDDRFDDVNETVVENSIQHYPTAASMEMETFMLFHLAKCSKISIRASAACIVLANRLSCKVVDEWLVSEIEKVGGRAALLTVAQCPL
jgi:uridine phosphorylase